MTGRKKYCFGLAIAFLLSTAAPLLSQNASDAASELARAAQSPYDIQHFVETHFAFDWTPLWTALSLGDTTPQPNHYPNLNVRGWRPHLVGLLNCEGDQERHNCSAELITVDAPPQTIVLLSDGYDLRLYLRFVSEPQPGRTPHWRFSGYFNQYVKYWSPEHRIVTLGGKPYLVANEQGIYGTGLASEIESWRDLSGAGMNPVLLYTKQGHFEGSEEWFIRDFEAVTISPEEKPVPSLSVAYNVDFSGYRNPPMEPDLVGLGQRTDKIVYLQTRVGEFTIDKKLSTLTSEGTLSLYGAEGPGPSCEGFLRYDLTSLKEVARGDSGVNSKNWLRRFLKKCKDTNEKRQLSDLLGAPSTSRVH